MIKRIQTDVTGSGEIYHVYALLKFGHEEHLKDLLNRGVIFFSSKQQIRGSKKEYSDDFRYDSLEGATVYEAHGAGIHTLQNTETGEEFNLPVLKVLFHGKPEIVYGNIACFYGITNENFLNGELIPVDGRMKQFGSHFIIIYNYEHFMRRIASALDKIQLNHSVGKIEYFDEDSHKGELHKHHKRSRLSYQNEFRIHLERQSTEPFKLTIGNLREFAAICHCDTLEHLKMKLDLEKKSIDLQYLKQKY